MVNLQKQTNIQRASARKYLRRCRHAALEEAQLRYEWIATWLVLNTVCKWEFSKSFPQGRVVFAGGEFFIKCSTQFDGFRTIVIDVANAGHPTVLIERIKALGIEYTPYTGKLYMYYTPDHGVINSVEAAALCGISPNTFRMRSLSGWSVETIRKFPYMLRSQWEKTLAI